NRENMARNRMRYLVHEMGWTKFQQLALKERSIVDSTLSFSTAKSFDFNSEKDISRRLPESTRAKLKLPVINEGIKPDASTYDRWIHTNIVAQRQEGYNVVFVTLGVGDITSSQLRGLA